MTAGNDFDPDTQPEIFSALLTPHRSLNRTGFLAVMAFLSVVSFATGVAFLLMGAWPVFGFFGLDVLAVYVAFRINFRRARASEEIRITPTELRLLAYLVRRRGLVLSKHQLLTQVWGYDAYDPNVVEVHVSALRRKLEAHGPRILHTVRGLGYRLNP